MVPVKSLLRHGRPSPGGTQPDSLGEADPGTLSPNPCGPARFAANVTWTSPWARWPPHATRHKRTPCSILSSEEGSAGGDRDSRPPSGALQGASVDTRRRGSEEVSVRRQVKQPVAPGGSLRTRDSGPPLPAPAARSLTRSETRALPGGEAVSASRRPPHLFRGLRRPAPGPCQSLAAPAGPCPTGGSGPGASRTGPCTPGRATAPTLLSRTPRPREHPSGVAGPLKSKRDGHPGPRGHRPAPGICPRRRRPR